MKIIKPSVVEIKQNYNLDGIYKSIEIAGRNCYKSENNICEGSAEKLIENFKARKHGAPMEFGTVYLTVPVDCEYNPEGVREFYKKNKYSIVNEPNYNLESAFNAYITTNYRVLFENDRLDDLKYLTEPSEYHEKRRFFRIICDRGILAEVTRHRSFSFCVESTRYCNYEKDKFGNEITVIEPCWCYDKDTNSAAYKDFAIWKKSCEDSEKQYFALIGEGWTPEKARSVLNNSLKTDICMCGFESDWKHFFDLRCDQKAHPQAKEVADMIKELF